MYGRVNTMVQGGGGKEPRKSVYRANSTCGRSRLVEEIGKVAGGLVFPEL